MMPFLILLISVLVLRAMGAAGLPVLDDWVVCLRGGLAVMFLVTASAHWGKRRPDLIRMVPSVFPWPGVIVTITGFLEILGAAGLLLASTADAAAACLAALLIAMFPGNVHAALHNLSIGGKRVTPLPLRTGVQIAIILALAVAGFPDAIAVWAAPAKRPSAVRSEKAREADMMFWDALH